jgi:hypothetical protein
MVKLMRGKPIASSRDGPHRVGSQGMVRSLGLGCTTGTAALYLLFRDVWACVWDCPAGCTSIAIAALLGYGYHLSYHCYRSNNYNMT